MLCVRRNTRFVVWVYTLCVRRHILVVCVGAYALHAGSNGDSAGTAHDSSSNPTAEHDAAKGDIDPGTDSGSGHVHGSPAEWAAAVGAAPSAPKDMLPASPDSSQSVSQSAAAVEAAAIPADYDWPASEAAAEEVWPASTDSSQSSSQSPAEVSSAPKTPLPDRVKGPKAYSGVAITHVNWAEPACICESSVEVCNSIMIRLPIVVVTLRM